MNLALTPLKYALSAAMLGRPIARCATLLAGGVLLGALTAPAAHADGWDGTLAFGAASSRSVKKTSLTLGTTQTTPLWQGDTWRLRLRHEFELGFWHVPQARDILEAGYSPVLRLERPLSGEQSLYFEGSIGARLLSHTLIGPGHTMSTAFQFSDMIGLGMQWGRSTVGLRLQHLSNADIKRPNPGINFLQVRYTYLF